MDYETGKRDSGREGEKEPLRLLEWQYGGEKRA